MIPHNQILTWYQTSNCVKLKKLRDISKTVIKTLSESGIFVLVEYSDKGSADVGMWQEAGISVKETCRTFINHPSVDNRKLYFMADIPHIINICEMP